MKRIISMAVVLVITIAVMARRGKLAINENISGKDNVSSDEKKATPIDRKPRIAPIFGAYGEISVTKPVSETEHYLGSDITGGWNTFIWNYAHERDVTIGSTDSSVEILKPSIYKAINRVNKHYRKALKKEEVSREVATSNMSHILDCANAMCLDDNSKSFEETLKSADESGEIIALFNQVTLGKL